MQGVHKVRPLSQLTTWAIEGFLELEDCALRNKLIGFAQDTELSPNQVKDLAEITLRNCSFAPGEPRIEKISKGARWAATILMDHGANSFENFKRALKDATNKN